MAVSDVFGRFLTIVMKIQIAYPLLPGGGQSACLTLLYY